MLGGSPGPDQMSQGKVTKALCRDLRDEIPLFYPQESVPSQSHCRNVLSQSLHPPFPLLRGGEKNQSLPEKVR